MTPVSDADASRGERDRAIAPGHPEEDVIDPVEPTTPADTTTDEPQAPAPADDADVSEQKATADVMALLNQHVPLALLADLAQPEGPASPKILADEGLPDEPWWE